MQIRRMVSADIPALAELYKQFWGDNSNIAKMNEVFQRIEHNRNFDRMLSDYSYYGE